MADIIIMLDIHNIENKSNIENVMCKFMYEYFPYVNIDKKYLVPNKDDLDNTGIVYWRYYYNVIDMELSSYTYVVLKDIKCTNNICIIRLQAE